MKRREFLTVTGTFTGGLFVLPDFLYAFGKQPNSLFKPQTVVFIQLNGGNDGLNTLIPVEDPLYYHYRPNIGIDKNSVISGYNGLGFHPSLKGLAQIQQNGDLSIVQNVGYPEPNRSHFRSREIWQTASDSEKFLTTGWLGRYLDLECVDHIPTAGLNIDSLDNLALRGLEPNSITVRNPDKFRTRKPGDTISGLSDNPQLDFVRKIAYSTSEGTEEIQKALKKSTPTTAYPKTRIGKNLEWICRLIKGDLNTRVYYTSHNGFDTHDNQVKKHAQQLKLLDQGIFALYSDLKESNLLDSTTVVIFSEFGRRVKDNGSGTDHGTAAPMFVIGGNNHGGIIGNNPNLSNLDKGDLIYEIDFRSVYAALLNEKMEFDPKKVGIHESPLKGLF